MTSHLSDLVAQKELIERQIQEARAAAKSEAIGRVRELMAQHGVTHADLLSSPKDKQGAKSGGKVAPKYRDPATGSTWTGRGLKPKWLAAAVESGKKIEEFAL